MWLNHKLLEAQSGSSLDGILLTSKQEALAGYEAINIGSFILRPFTPSGAPSVLPYTPLVLPYYAPLLP